MRRTDREIQELSEIYEILGRCDTVRIGIAGDIYPYVVPVSFGLEVTDEKGIIYFHCARQGLKTDLLARNNNVCIEADRFFCVEKWERGITTRYESVIGFGKCVEITDLDEMKKGLRLMTEHYDFPDYPLDRCRGIENLRMFKIEIESITGKRNPTDKEKG